MHHGSAHNVDILACDAVLKTFVLGDVILLLTTLLDFFAFCSRYLLNFVLSPQLAAGGAFLVL